MKSIGLTFRSVLLSAVLILFITSVVIADTRIPPGKWPEYVSSMANAKISFPALPEIVEDEVDAGSHCRATYAPDENTMYMFDAIEHINDLSGVEDLAAISFDSFFERVGGDLIYQMPWLYRDYEGVEAKISLSSEQIFIYYRVLIVGQFQYQMVVFNSSFDDKKMGKNRKKFFDSFRMTN